MVWCFVPWEEYNGSILIYNNIISKLVTKYEAQIDKGLKEASAFAKDAAKQGKTPYKDCSMIVMTDVGMGMAKDFVSNPSTMQKAYEYGSKMSETLSEEEGKKDS